MRLFTVLLLAVFVIGFGWLQQYSSLLYEGDVYYLEDSQSTLALPDLINRQWDAGSRAPVNVGYSNSTFWFYLPVPAAMVDAGVPYVMEIDFPTIDRLDFYHVSQAGETLAHYQTGTDFDFSTRPLWDDDWVFPLDSMHNGDRILIRASTSNSLQMPIRFYTRSEFLEEDVLGLLMWGAFYGLALIMAAYSLFNGIIIRDRMYVYYSCYIVMSVLTSAALNGHGFAYLWPQTPAINSVSLTVFPCLVISFGTAFALEYLGFTRKRSRERYVGYGLIATGFVTASVALIMNRDLSFWTAVEIVIFSIAMLVMGVLSLYRGHYLGWYFLAGWSGFLLGACMFGLNVLGLLPFNPITVHSKEVGSAFEIIMLSLGMSAIYNYEKEERFRIDNAIDGMNQRLQKRLNLINSKSGALEIPQLNKHLQDIRSLGRRTHQEMGRVLVVSVQVIDRTTRRPDYLAQTDCLRGLFNSRVTVFPFNTQREGLHGEITVLLFPLHNKFEAEPILERVESWQISLGEQYDLHFGYAISHLTEKYEADYIDESLHNLEEAIQRRTVAYSIGDTLGFAPRQQPA